jgi:hypothetical protein
MLEALLRDERTGPPSAAAIKSALQALVPTPPAAIALDPPAANAPAAAAGAPSAADAQQHEPQHQSQSQQQPAGDARPSLKEQAQARRAARRQSQVRWAPPAALQHSSCAHTAGVAPCMHSLRCCRWTAITPRGLAPTAPAVAPSRNAMCKASVKLNPCQAQVSAVEEPGEDAISRAARLSDAGLGRPSLGGRGTARSGVGCVAGLLAWPQVQAPANSYCRQ